MDLQELTPQLCMAKKENAIAYIHLHDIISAKHKQNPK